MVITLAIYYPYKSSQMVAEFNVRGAKIAQQQH